ARSRARSHAGAERRHDRAVPRRAHRHARFRSDRVRDLGSSVGSGMAAGGRHYSDRADPHRSRHHLPGIARRGHGAGRGVALRMKYELQIGSRYLRASRGNRFVSFISTISMAGLAIGVAVLIVVLSVMNGFEREVRERILSLTSHASITAYSSRLSDWQDAARRVRVNPSVVAAAPFIEDQALLIGTGAKTSGAIVTGILPAQE